MKNICDNEEEHKARVEAVKAAMPADEKIFEMGARFKVISEPSRLKIILALEGGGAVRRAHNRGGRRQPKRGFTPA